jgi:CDP-diacylglycerol--serine O-phosphatidyltransferase
MNISIKRHLPNFITSLNLASGCIALVFVFKGEVALFSVFVAASLVFDFLDGFVARAFKAWSPMGKELDSLADMVTFGLVPGAIMYHLFIKSVPLVLYLEADWAKIAGFFPFIITVFSALRLAKFNIDTRQSDSFLGMPTPAITIFVVGFALIIQFDRFHVTPVLLNSYVISGITMVLCYLLACEIPLFALKFKSLSWSANKVQYSLIGIGIIMIAWLQLVAIPLLIIIYLILSLLNNYFHINTDPLKTEKP